MKRLAASVFPAGLIAGQAFNGPATERFGVYLILVAGLWLLLGARTTRGGRA